MEAEATEEVAEQRPAQPSSQTNQIAPPRTLTTKAALGETKDGSGG
jgi:hypothetical protein